MIITCPNCTARFSVPPAAIPPAGRKLRCAKCAHMWFFKPEAEAELPPAPVEETTPPAAITEPEASPAEPLTPAADGEMEPLIEWRDETIPNISINQTIAKKPAASGTPAKKLSFALMAITILMAPLVFHDKLYHAPLIGSVLEMVGISDTHGLILEKTNIQVLAGRRENSYFIQGTIKNTAESPRLVPVLRVTLADDQGGAVHYVDYQQEALMLEAGKTVPFSAEIKNKSTRVASVYVDLGNKLQLGMR